MKKSQERTDAKKKEIARAALELFFEKGYEETSIRMIQKKVGREPGLFYYYFESKDAVFEAAIDLFFQSYERQMREITERGRTRTEGVLTEYLTYIYEATQDFRQRYLARLHWSILGAIREYTLRIMQKYILEILGMYAEKGLLPGENTNLEVTANLLAYGIGGSILYQDAQTYRSQEKEISRFVTLLLGDLQ